MHFSADYTQTPSYPSWRLTDVELQQHFQEDFYLEWGSTFYQGALYTLDIYQNREDIFELILHHLPRRAWEGRLDNIDANGWEAQEHWFFTSLAETIAYCHELQRDLELALMEQLL